MKKWIEPSIIAAGIAILVLFVTKSHMDTVL
jgi:hypothetical protein